MIQSISHAPALRLEVVGASSRFDDGDVESLAWQREKAGKREYLIQREQKFWLVKIFCVLWPSEQDCTTRKASEWMAKQQTTSNTLQCVLTSYSSSSSNCSNYY